MRKPGFALLPRCRRATLAAASLGVAVVLLLAAPGPARADSLAFATPTFPDLVHTGETFGAFLTITNFSFGPEATAFPVLDMSEINLVPSCDNSALDCLGGIEADVFTLSPTGFGSGPVSCLGTWAITEIAPGVFRFTPPNGEGTLQLATGESCIVDFTVTTLRVPTFDIGPDFDVQTNQMASSTRSAPGLAPVRSENSDQTTVLQSGVDLDTQAVPTAPLGSPISDTASLAPDPFSPPPAVAPTGAIFFDLYGPNDPNCLGSPVFVSGVPVTGFGDYNSGDFAPTAVGPYNWQATYSGDVIYRAQTTPCDAPGETSQITAVQPTIVTQATPSVALGQPASDTASLAGGINPTGTVTFNLFGPNDPSCSGLAAFSSTVPVVGNGDYNSGPFVPLVAGDYNWVATYSGDVNNLSAATACGDPSETTAVTAGAVQPTLSTQATTGATLGELISDTATLELGSSPTQSITFTLFGPNDPTCSSTPIFSSTVPVAGNGNYDSGPFLPLAAGDYQWVASYIGDANNLPVTSACGDTGETSDVGQALPTVATQATPTAIAGQPISDTAFVTGLPSPLPPPTGTVSFILSGPNDSACSPGSLVFFDPDRPLAGSPPTATANPFTPSGPGVYRWAAFYSGDANYVSVALGCNDPNEISVVAQAVPTITTSATPTATLVCSLACIFGPLSDTATVTGVAGTPPTGAVTFTVFGPDDATCSGPAAFTSADRPLSGLPPPTATSDPFTPPVAGTYRWIAAYSGDANYAPVTSPCNEPNETSVATTSATLVTSQATPTTAIGGSISDTATVAGVSSSIAPTGTVTFTVFGPNDATCTGAPVFTSADRPLGGTSPSTTVLGPPPTATSDAFTPLVAGTYRWIAAYSGDASYPPEASACNAAGETSVVTQAAPAITTQATPNATAGEPIADTATLIGGFNPTGTITFTLYGPDDAACTGPAAFSSTVPVANNGSYVSAPFVPSAAGSYRWTAAYSGDVNNLASAAACNAPGETSIVTPLPVIQIVKTATPLSLPEPGGNFVFNLVITNPSNEVLTITSLTDDVYGDVPTLLTTTCTGAIGTVLAANGGSYECSFVGPFTGVAGDSQTDVVTVIGENPTGIEVTDDDDAVVTLTPAPTIEVTNSPAPPSLPEPGGDFTHTVVVTNNSVSAALIDSLTDNVYGDLSNQGTCTTAVGTLLSPGATYTCQFTGPFTGNAGSGQTDTVTVVASFGEFGTATGSGPATVLLTDVLPTISVDEVVSPPSLPAPGGDFSFSVAIRNNSFEPVAITSIFNSVYGDLTTRSGSSCSASGSAPLGPGSLQTCSFTAPFTGTAGASQIDTVTASAVDDDGSAASDSDQSAVALTANTPSLTTSASGPVTVGGAISDTANLSGAHAPTGTITFSLFGPGDAACTAPVFAATVLVSGNGAYNSGAFFTTAPGAHRWVAAYSGDANNTAVAGACGDPGETSLAAPADIPIEIPPDDPLPGNNPPADDPLAEEPVTTQPTVTVPPTTATTATTATTTTLPPTTTTTIDVIVADLTLDPPVISPGGTLSVTGQGCDPNAAVTLFVDGRVVGTAQADENGRFSGTATPVDNTVRRFRLVAECGPTIDELFDIVLTGQVDAATSTFLVLLFVLLFALALGANRVLNRGGRYAK